LTEYDKLDLPDSLELFIPDENYLDDVVLLSSS
jgi:hypothetical protein